MTWVPNIRASKKLCQPDKVRATKSPLHLIHHALHVPVGMSKLTIYWLKASKMVRCRLAPTVRSSPTGRLIAKYFNRESTSAMLWKRRTAHRGRFLRPPTPCLADFDPKSIGRVVDESVIEMLSWGSPDSISNFSNRLSGTSRNSHHCILTALGTTSWHPLSSFVRDVQMTIMGWQVSQPAHGLFRKSSGKRCLQSQHWANTTEKIYKQGLEPGRKEGHTPHFTNQASRKKHVSHHRAHSESIVCQRRG